MHTVNVYYLLCIEPYVCMFSIPWVFSINLALYITCAKCKLKIVTVLAVHTEVYIFIIRVNHVTVCILHTKYRTVYNIYRVHCILLKCILNTKNRAVYNTYRVHCIVLQCILHTKYRTVYTIYVEYTVFC